MLSRHDGLVEMDSMFTDVLQHEGLVQRVSASDIAGGESYWLRYALMLLL